MPRILIIDDEANMRRILRANLVLAGHTVVEADGSATGMRLLASEDFDAVFVDHRMRDGLGLDVIRGARQADSTLSIIMLTAAATVDLAVEAMRLGAFDFLTKPCVPEVIATTAQRACEYTALLRENNRLRRQVGEREGVGDIYGSSTAIRVVREVIGKVAQTSTTALITGETGTGKELVARAIHNSSSRAAKPFIAVNCAAFTESLLETELFGHEKGAFTGAERSHQGLFEAANHGTLFLDEAGEMSLTAQAKLLRVLTDGLIMRVGSTETRKVDVRVIVATHRDLATLVDQGKFRQDLFYRLAIIPIHIPPLRERAEDIPVLCEVLSQQISRDLKTPQRRISAEAMANLRAYSFPGNVRELRNLLERAYILSSNEVLGPECFAVPGVGPKVEQLILLECSNCRSLQHFPQGFSLPDFLEKIETTVIENAMNSAGGVQAEAARMLGLSRSMLNYKLNKQRPPNQLISE